MTTCPPCQTGSTPWNTPLPGNLIAVPPGSQVIAVPQAGCGCDETQDAAGSMGGSSPAPATSTGFTFPAVTQAFTMPAVNAIGQFYSTGASQWAAPNLTLWLPAFNGYVSVTGVSNDLITFKNLTMAQGTTVIAGTPLIPSAPVSSTAAPSKVSLLDAILGTVNGISSTVQGSQGQILRRGASQWELVNGPQLQLINSQPIALTIKRDVVNSTSTSTATNGKWLAPVLSAINQTAPTGTMIFPSFPTLEAGQSIVAYVRVKWKMGVLTSDSLRITVTINGVTWQVVQFAETIADSAALANTAAFTSAMNNKCVEGSDFLLIPIPVDNAPVNVSVDVRKAANTAAPLDANSHYVVDFHVMGYLY